MMDDEKQKKPEEIIRETLGMITEHRKDVMDRVRNEILAEVKQMEKKGFDPARGRGRGPWWVEGDRR